MITHSDAHSVFVPCIAVYYTDTTCWFWFAEHVQYICVQYSTAYKEPL